MQYSITKKPGEPAYLQLYRMLRDDIIGGVFPFASRLPSKRLIAEETGLSLVTVEHAYALLCDEGYVRPRERSGYFVLFRTGDPFAASPVHRSTAVEPPHRPSATPEFPVSVLTRTMRRVMSDLGNAILEPSPSAGIPALRDAIGQYLARSRGIHVTADQIVIGSGSEYLYGQIVDLLGRELTYAIESPSYKKIRQVYESCDVRVQMLPLGADGIDSFALSGCSADVLHITPYRSFPSGVTASASKRHEYLRWAADGRYLIEDDFESEFSVSRKPEETLFAHTDRDNVLYLNTFSKTISPSIRAGYLVLPRHLTSVFRQKLGFYSCTVPTFMQYVLAQLLTDGDFERHINRVRRKKRREMLGDD